MTFRGRKICGPCFIVAATFFVAITTVAFIPFLSPKQLECARAMNERVEFFRVRVGNDFMPSLSNLSSDMLETIVRCQNEYIRQDLDPGFSHQEYRGWIKAMAIQEVKAFRQRYQGTGFSGSPDGTIALLKSTVAQNTPLELEDFGTSFDELYAIRKNWAVKKLAVWMGNLSKIQPDGKLQTGNDFDASLAEAENFRTEYALEWEDIGTSDVSLQCLRGQFYAGRARALLKSLRYYQAPDNSLYVTVYPTDLVKEIVSATEKKGFCGYDIPEIEEINKFHKIAWARLAEKILSELRAKQYSFPDSLSQVENLRKILKLGNIKPEELGTSERELQILSRENPLLRSYKCDC